MLKKKLGIEAIESDWNWWKKVDYLSIYYKIPSSLIIPEGVEKIGLNAFVRCDLEKVEIPGSVYVIRGGAFDGCRKLEKLVISEGVERIEEFAFEGCRKLGKVVIPKSVKEIGEFAFCWCSEAVVTLRKPRSEFEYISPDAFKSCRDVKEETRN